MNDKGVEQGDPNAPLRHAGAFHWKTFVAINLFSTCLLLAGWAGVDFLKTTSGVRYEYSFIGYNLAYLVRRLFGVMFEKKKFFEFE